MLVQDMNSNTGDLECKKSMDGVKTSKIKLSKTPKPTFLNPKTNLLETKLEEVMTALLNYKFNTISLICFSLINLMKLKIMLNI
jgi:hypothetical protein